MSAEPAGRVDSDGAFNRVIRAIFDATQDALAILDPQDRLFASNASFAAMWQVPADMLLRGDSAELREWVARQLTDAAAFARIAAHPMQPGQAPQVDVLEHVDGRVLERREMSLLIDCSASRAAGRWIFQRWRDITERVHVERTVRASSAQAAAVFNFAHNAIVLADDQGQCLDANPAACELLGQSVAQLRLAAAGAIVRLGTDEMAAAWRLFLQRGSASGHLRLWQPDGTPRDVRFEAVASIQPGVHLAILSDETNEVRQRQRQLESAAQMESAMAHAEIVFWVVDLVADQVTSANPQWLQQVLGYPSEEIASGMAAWDALVHPDDYDAREASWMDHVQGHSPRFEAEFRMRHRDGHWVWLLARGTATERDRNGLARRVVGTRIDITQRKLGELALQALAFSDGLTGALNRRRFLELAKVEIDRCRRYDQPMAVLVVDVDHFKAINDMHGHAVGDQVLHAFVQGVMTILRGSDLFARIGGDEFAGLLPQTDAAGAQALAERLLAVVRANPVVTASGVVAYSVSVGVAMPGSSSSHSETIDALLGAADQALYQAKGQGRDRFVLTTPD